MNISIIVAMASNRVIGINNQMPWQLSADLKKFKQITMGHAILMGRRTFESIGKPLPGRTNIIISRDRDYQQSGCYVFNEIEAALKSCHEKNELFIIGGLTIYEKILPIANLIYVTKINQEFVGDVYFPEISSDQWLEIEREDITRDPEVSFSYSFIKMQRRELVSYKDQLGAKI